MTKLVITRGISGSGKSTWARKWVSEDPQHRAEVNRDNIRIMLHGGHVVGPRMVLDQDTEAMVTAVSHNSIRELLKRGVDVVCSDTNLRQHDARQIARIGRMAGADVEVIDLTHVPLDVCLERNEEREGEGLVPEAVIRRQYERFVAGRNGKPLPLPTEDLDKAKPDLVEYNPNLPTVVLCDIDGTVALKGTRSPYDETRVHEDRPNQAVIELVEVLWNYGNGYKIVFMSGRSDACRDETILWLEEHLHMWDIELHMRPAHDRRKDSIVKRELFEQHIRGQYNVLCVLDDRDQVVQMWREELGLTCLQVAPGDF